MWKIDEFICQQPTSYPTLLLADMPFPLSLRKQGAGIFQRVRNPLWWNLRLLVTASTSLSVALAQRCWCQKTSNTNTRHFLVHYAWNRYSNTRALQAVVKSCTTAPSSICFPSRLYWQLSCVNILCSVWLFTDVVWEELSVRGLCRWPEASWETAAFWVKPLVFSSWGSAQRLVSVGLRH